MHQTITYVLHRPADRFSPGLMASSPTASLILKYAKPTPMILPRHGNCGKITWANQVREVAINYNSKSIRSTSGSTNTATTRRYLAKILYGIAESLPIPLLSSNGHQRRGVLALPLWLVVSNLSALRGQYEPECSTISSFHVTPLIWNAPDTPLMYIDPSDLIL
jgi:hypothetical protein